MFCVFPFTYGGFDSSEPYRPAWQVKSQMQYILLNTNTAIKYYLRMINDQ